MRKSFSYAPRPFAKGVKYKKILHISSTIYVTNTDRNGKRAKDSEFKRRVHETENFALEIFGGYTTDYVDHGKFSSKNGVLREKVAKVLCFSDEKNFEKHKKRIETWLMQKRKEWNQETVAYEFEGDLFYI